MRAYLPTVMLRPYCPASVYLGAGVLNVMGKSVYVPRVARVRQPERQKITLEDGREALVEEVRA